MADRDAEQTIELTDDEQGMIIVALLCAHHRQAGLDDEELFEKLDYDFAGSAEVLLLKLGYDICGTPVFVGPTREEEKVLARTGSTTRDVDQLRADLARSRADGEEVLQHKLDVTAALEDIDLMQEQIETLAQSLGEIVEAVQAPRIDRYYECRSCGKRGVGDPNLCPRCFRTQLDYRDTRPW